MGRAVGSRSIRPGCGAGFAAAGVAREHDQQRGGDRDGDRVDRRADAVGGGDPQRRAVEVAGARVGQQHEQRQADGGTDPRSGGDDRGGDSLLRGATPVAAAMKIAVNIVPSPMLTRRSPGRSPR